MSDRAKVIKVAGGLLIAASVGVTSMLAKWEPAKSDPGLVYADKLAGGLPTVCNGITRHITTTPVIVGQRWAPEKCAEEESAAIEKVQRQLAKCFTRTPPQIVFDMATSHAWNNGAANTCGSLAMAAWNEGQWEVGCRRLSLSDDGRPVWSFARTGRILPNGKPEMRFVQGLANRRADETAKCLAGLPTP